MRLIDADALLYKLTEEMLLTEMVRRSTGGEYEYGIEAARLVVMDAPTVGGWISVKDRLPETGACALVFGSAGALTIARYVAGDEWAVPGIFSAITHWMPLPEPPKEE